MLADYQRLMRQWNQHELEGAPLPAAARPAAGPALDMDVAQAFLRAQSSLSAELISLIHAHEPSFFEELVIDVLLAMGYGGRRRDLSRRLGRSGDGGVDGLVSMDELGLDLIYVQAKRLKPGAVEPVSEVRDCAGALDAHHASKGIFVATSHFSPAAIGFCEQVSRRVVLVDGRRLADMMIRFNVGVRVERSYQFKRIDLDYFRAVAPRNSARK